MTDDRSTVALVESLQARLDEDERAARDAESHPAEAFGSEVAAAHGLRWRPARAEPASVAPPALRGSNP